MVWGALEDAVATPCGLIWNCTLVVGAVPRPPTPPLWLLALCLLFFVAVSRLFCFFSFFPL